MAKDNGTGPQNIAEKLRGIREAQKKELISLALAKKGEPLSPEEVVDFARNPETALHSWFEWDDTVAAEKHRLWQARQVLRIPMEKILPDFEPPSHVFVSLRDDRKPKAKGGGYRLMIDVLTEDEQRERMLDDALAELEIFKTKYHILEELSSIFDEMTRLQRTRRRNTHKKELAA